MPQYRVKETSFINNKLVQEGDVVEYDGRPGKNLELIKGKAPKAPKADEPAADEKPEDETELV